MEFCGSSSKASLNSSGNLLISSFRSNLMSFPPNNDAITAAGGRRHKKPIMVPHQGALCRTILDDSDESSSVAATTNPVVLYSIEIDVAVATAATPGQTRQNESDYTHELKFTVQDFDFCQRLFAIIDTESRGMVDRETVKEFVTLRCPVFNRRDDDLRRVQAADEAVSIVNDSNTNNSSKSGQRENGSPTFDEVWRSVVECSKMPQMRLTDEELVDVELNVEGWMVFCRFVALAQYLEAKRRFSARHSQQTMRHRNSPRGSEVVVVDVPPPEPPAPLSSEQLSSYEKKSRTPLPLPELDLDHSLVAAHDLARRRSLASPRPGNVKISLFGSYNPSSYPTSSTSALNSKVEFTLSYAKNPEDHCSENVTVVRRSMEDMKWLNDTFTSHNVLGGTLCGRILPPFPGSSGKNSALHIQTEELLNTSIKNTTGGAIAAATVGAGIIKDVAKSIWNKSSGKAPSVHLQPIPKKAPTQKIKTRPSSLLHRTVPESYYNPNSPEGKARQVERYLNYLLEHPALSTSFPLNTILTASQSGLEAAKSSLEECLRLSKEVKDQIPQLVDGKTIIPFWGSNQGPHPSLSWVRTAAQAAMALKVHGMLETSGMQSASARLQHASLPTFNHPPGTSLDWGEEEQERTTSHAAEDGDVLQEDRANSFEQGVISVQSELQTEVNEPNDEDAYDLLPLPIPAPERRILSVGNNCHGHISSSYESDQSRSSDRFHYGASSLNRRFPLEDEIDAQSAFLGDISVDEHIDKLREVIGSVDNTLSRCLASSGGIGKARRERIALHLEIVQGFDSWKGLRGKFIGQRPLLKGLSGLEQSNEVYEESDLALVDDVSWQTNLANSAVSAAEDVRSAVRAVRTAENAKAAASAASYTAQSACDSGTFQTIDEARAAQTRASIAQSHAFHAAVVEHEAKAIKRRATLALANDVKCWNVHRKREMLQACISHARSQHEATRRAVDAWSCLRDGFIGSPIMPATQTRKVPATLHRNTNPNTSSRKSSKVESTNNDNSSSSITTAKNVDLLSAGVFTDLLDTFNSNLTTPALSAAATVVRETSNGGESSFSCIDVPLEASELQQSERIENEATATIYEEFGSNEIVAVEHILLAPQQQEEISATFFGETEASAFDETKGSGDDGVIKDDAGFGNEILPFVTASPVDEENSVGVSTDEATGSIDANLGKTSSMKASSSGEDNETMSASMQSLVDGLMSWGGQFETEDLLGPLPTGMAASIAFEESEFALQSTL